MASRRPTDSPRKPAPTSSAPTSPTPASTAESTSSAKAPTVHKPRAPRAKKAAAPKPPVPVEISEDVRRGMIAEAAYLRAERRGFTGGAEKEKEDWLLAEAEVEALLKAGQGSSAQ
jgi:Protein of unknown function (DUF2934)